MGSALESSASEGEYVGDGCKNELSVEFELELGDIDEDFVFKGDDDEEDVDDEDNDLELFES